MRRLGAEEEVPPDRHQRHHGEVLVDRRDALRARVARRAEVDLLSVDEQSALVRLVDARKDLDEARLSRAVVAEDARHLAGVDVRRDVVQRDDVPVVLADVVGLEQVRPSSSRSLALLRIHGVQQHGREQDPALECVRPVAVPLRVDDPELNHAEHRGPEERADDGTEAAGQQATADDGADDEDELEADAFSRLHRAQLERLDDAHERGCRRRQHEKQNLGARDGDADVPGRVRLAARTVDPVPETRLCEQPGADDRDADPPEHLDLEGVVGEIAREDLVGRVEPARGVDVLDRCLPGQLERAGRVHTLEDEEGRKRDDEARQLRFDHRHAVDETDRQAEHQHEGHRRPDIHVLKGRQVAEQESRSCRSSRRRRGRTHRRSSAARRGPRRCRTAPPGRSTRPR